MRRNQQVNPVRMIPWGDLDLAPYQAPRSKNAKTWAKAIMRSPDRADRFDESLVEVLEVSLRDDRYNIVDGQGWELVSLSVQVGDLDENYYLPCKVHAGLSYEAEARLAYDFWVQRRLPTPEQKFLILLDALDARTMRLQQIVESHGFVIDGSNVANSVRCFSTMNTIMGRPGWDGLVNQTLGIISDAWPEPLDNRLDAKIIMGVLLYLDRNKDNPKASGILLSALKRTIGRGSKKRYVNPPSSIIEQAGSHRKGNTGGGVGNAERKVLEDIAGLRD